ncbi:MAG: O-antigen ligase family protein, partial [Chloroflexota bacterium]|nr:O-antigen ligase family protein [Chloroflexota bacterium]
MLIFLVLIFFRPFICALAFPDLNFIYSVVLLIFLAGYIIYRNPFSLGVPALKYPLILFCLALLICVIFSRNQFISLAELYKYISGMGLFLVGVSLSEKDKLSAIRTIILTGAVISFLAIYQYFFSFSHVSDYLSNNKLSFPFALDYLGRRRVFLPFVTPGVLGGYLAMIIPLSLVNKNRIWFTPLIFFALLLTRSPVAFLSLFCALVVYFCLQGKLKKSSILVLVSLFLLIVIMVIWRSASQKEYIRPIFSMAMRLNYWQENLMVVKAHPFVGVGLGNLNLQMSRYAHNSYLQILAEMGILGLLSFIWLVFAALSSGFNNLKQSIYRDQISG